MASGIDLTPFGLTPTESLVYGALLRLGPSTGYAVARATRLARANAYGALDGLVARGAALRGAGRPARYRPLDPQTLVAQLALAQGEALDRLSRALRDASRSSDPVTRDLSGTRAVANLVGQLVARAERSVVGVLGAELWRATLPAWRRAASRAKVTLRIAGDIPAGELEHIIAGSADPSAPTTLLVDDAQVVVAVGSGDGTTGLWSSHPLVAGLARGAIGALA